VLLGCNRVADTPRLATLHEISRLYGRNITPESTRKFLDRFRGFSGVPRDSFRWRRDRSPTFSNLVALEPPEHKAMKLHLFA
jgi:hypothetical protein